jgi:hypothetical protein
MGWMFRYCGMGDRIPQCSKVHAVTAIATLTPSGERQAIPHRPTSVHVSIDQYHPFLRTPRTSALTDVITSNRVSRSFADGNSIIETANAKLSQVTNSCERGSLVIQDYVPKAAETAIQIPIPRE